MTARIRIPLPSVASSPGNCAECDGFALGDTRLCAECTDASFRDRLNWRYQNDEGVRDWWYGEGWSIGRQFHPLDVRFGAQAELRLHRLGFALHLQLGLWSVWISVGLEL